MKRKREYWQPAMSVVELQVRNQLLAGSTGTSATQQDYGDGGDDDWARLFDSYEEETLLNN